MNRWTSALALLITLLALAQALLAATSTVVLTVDGMT
jgi:uncharacterized membrane protein